MTNLPLPNGVPRYALFRDKRVRIVGYSEETQKFEVFDERDQRRMLTRSQMTFLPERKKGPAVNG